MNRNTNSELYPAAIRAYATIKFKEPIPEETGNVWVDESFCINVDGEDIYIDFEECEISVNDDDRTLVDVMWKNPDWDEFSEEFDMLTLDALQNKKITLNDTLETVVCASKGGDSLDEDVIEIDHIVEMSLTAPHNDFKDVLLVGDENAPEKTMKQYEVYAAEIRDAQIYTGDTNDPDLAWSDSWRDISQDMLLDIVFAKDEDDAVRIVAEDEGMNMSSLYAVQHIVDTENVLIDGTSKRMSAASFSTDETVGIDVQLISGDSIRIETDRKTGQIKVSGWDPDARWS